MSSKQRQRTGTGISPQRRQHHAARRLSHAAESGNLAAVIQRTQLGRGTTSPVDVLQLQRMLGNRVVGELLGSKPRRRAPTTSSLPDGLKTGMEQLSRMDLGDVQVHYDSPKPAQLNALAYTQGSDIHVASGQEHHLPHEAWHVVQQKQGRVQPSLQMKGAALNDDPLLEREASAMGARALQDAAAQRHIHAPIAKETPGMAGKSPPANTKKHDISYRLTKVVKPDTKAVDEEPTMGKKTASPTFGAVGASVVQRAASVKSLTVKHISTSETETSASHRFDIRAEFNDESADWDFRQDIQGFWKLNGVKQELKSSGSGQVVPETGWVDDGYTKADDTNSDKKIFETNDNPGGGFSKDTPEDYYLKFRAKIIDPTASNAVLKEKSGYWIRIKGKYPRAFTQGGFDT